MLAIKFAIGTLSRSLFTLLISLSSRLMVIHSIDPRWGLSARGSGVSIHLQDLYEISIAWELLWD